MTPCECVKPGFCYRHQCQKSGHWWRLCRTSEDCFLTWEEFAGPGQDPTRRHVSPMEHARWSITLLMVTYQRLEYTQLAVEAMLSATYPELRFVIWDNASTDGTRQWLWHRLADEPRVSLVFSDRNMGVAHPMNSIWGQAKTPLVAKIDNDTLVPPDLLTKLAKLHWHNERLGVTSGCHFRAEDLGPMLDVDANQTQRSASDCGLLQQEHVGGCAVMMRRATYEKFGKIPTRRTSSQNPFLETGWTDYQRSLSRAGCINGYIWPPVFVDHMEDARSEHHVGSASHEDYKQAMRGQGLSEYTRKFYVEGAQRFRQSPQILCFDGEHPASLVDRSVARVTNSQSHSPVRQGDNSGTLPPGRAEKQPDDVTLFLPLAGRTGLWGQLASFLSHRQVPEQVKQIVMLDTSQNSDFYCMLSQWVGKCQHPDIRLLRHSVGPQGLADMPRREATAQVRQAMSRIYGRVQELLETEFLWILEDDILPPDDVLARLKSSLATSVSSVAAPYASRSGDRLVVWDSHGRNFILPGTGVTAVGGNGFGCVLLRSALFKATQFPPDLDCDRWFYQWLSKTGSRALVDWSCMCLHSDHHATQVDSANHLSGV